MATTDPTNSSSRSLPPKNPTSLLPSARPGTKHTAKSKTFSSATLPGSHLEATLTNPPDEELLELWRGTHRAIVEDQRLHHEALRKPVAAEVGVRADMVGVIGGKVAEQVRVRMEEEELERRLEGARELKGNLDAGVEWLGMQLPAEDSDDQQDKESRSRCGS